MKGKKVMGKIVSILLLASLFFIPQTFSESADRQKLVIAVQPTSTSEQLTSQAKELEQFLEKKLGLEVEIKFPTSYAGVVEALRFGHADIAFMGAWPAELARVRAGAEIVLAEVREVIIDDKKTEAPYYFSYWVVRKDSPYQSLKELAGKKVAFPSPLSTSGYVAPLAKLVELNLITRKEGVADTKTFFGEVFFAGGYAQAWEALKSGQVDAAIIAGDVPEPLYQEVLENTRILEKQGPIPSHAVVAGKDLEEPLRTNVVTALIELGQPEYQSLMRKFISGIFVKFEPATAKHSESLRKTLDETGLQFEEKKS
jgi:phosphonate transport system substrate-binding protein